MLTGEEEMTKDEYEQMKKRSYKTYQNKRAQQLNDIAPMLESAGLGRTWLMYAINNKQPRTNNTPGPRKKN